MFFINSGCSPKKRLASFTWSHPVEHTQSKGCLGSRQKPRPQTQFNAPVLLTPCKSNITVLRRMLHWEKHNHSRHSNSTHKSVIIASHLNHPFSALSKKIHMPHCSYTTHNPVTTAAHLSLFLHLLRSVKETEVHSDGKNFGHSQCKNAKRGYLRLTGHSPKSAPAQHMHLGFSRHSSFRNWTRRPTSSKCRLVGARAAHHNTLGPCVRQKHRLGGVMASNGGSLKVGEVTSQLAGAVVGVVVAAVGGEHALLPLHVRLVE